MKELVINVEKLETRIALLENNKLAELIIERAEAPSLVGNIYKGRVEDIVAGIQAAFINIGTGKNGFLYVSDISKEFEDFTIDEEMVPKPIYKKGFQGPPKIQDLIRENQYLLVQVVKDQIGNKGARLTTFITLPGRYVVLFPTINATGISRKIDSEKERERLKKIIQQIKPKDMGIVLRTASNNKPLEDLKNDVDYLLRLWEQIQNKFHSLKGPGLIREDLSPILRVVRDRFTKEINRLTIDDAYYYEKILKFLDILDPHLKTRVKLYKLKTPIFSKMNIEKEIEKLFHRNVPLKSGGYITIDLTEALVAIDVNTGSFTGKKELEETILQTNLEAAEEIARQVRLRDLSGIIVIDFIDMTQEQNRKKLLNHFLESLKNDRAKITISEITQLGMIEMTRQRVKQNVVKTLSQSCPYCEGKGYIRSVTTVMMEISRRLKEISVTAREKKFILQAHPAIIKRYREEYSEILDDFCKKNNIEINLESVSDFHLEDYRILSGKSRYIIESRISGNFSK
ncbi:MAG: Rne/Rng family ribonuclease [Candidatus Hydrogenedentes bacterium]|nr:Rne/Rng family ribonuclease [Candidatus Hydrogenedentota bacterium]